MAEEMVEEKEYSGKYIRVPITLKDGREIYREFAYWGLGPLPSKDELRAYILEHPKSRHIFYLGGKLKAPSELTLEENRQFYPELYKIKE